jgi:hypothetical protein
MFFEYFLFGLINEKILLGLNFQQKEWIDLKFEAPIDILLWKVDKESLAKLL